MYVSANVRAISCAVMARGAGHASPHLWDGVVCYVYANPFVDLQKWCFSNIYTYSICYETAVYYGVFGVPLVRKFNLWL